MTKTFCDGCGAELGVGRNRPPAAVTGETCTTAPYPLPSGSRFHLCGRCAEAALAALRAHVTPGGTT